MLSTTHQEGCYVRLVILNLFEEPYRYLSFLSLKTGVLRLLEILSQGRQGPILPTQSLPLLLMTWWCKEPGHQQPWYWPGSPRMFSPSKELICRFTWSCLTEIRRSDSLKPYGIFQPIGPNLRRSCTFAWKKHSVYSKRSKVCNIKTWMMSQQTDPFL